MCQNFGYKVKICQHFCVLRSKFWFFDHNVSKVSFLVKICQHFAVLSSKFGYKVKILVFGQHFGVLGQNLVFG